MMNMASVCEEKIYTEIFRDYAKTLHNYLYYKSGDATLAEDYTQEAFSKLWQNCQDVLVESAKGYVFKIANNLMLNGFKHQKVVLKHRAQPQSDQSKESPEFLLEQKEFRGRLEQAIADLPEKQRVVFLLSRIDKKTYKEIADMLGISKQAVEKRMYKALDALRKVSKLIK